MNRSVCIFGGSSGIGQWLHQIEWGNKNKTTIVDKIAPFQRGADYIHAQLPGPIDWVSDHRFDLVYCTIGNPSARKFSDIDDNEDYEHKVFLDNYYSVVSAIRQAHQHSSKTITSYVLVSSLSASRADPTGTAYAGAKAAIESLVRGLAREWAPIRVNAVAPGPTATRQFLKNVPLENQKKEAMRSPSQRLISPQEVAKAMYALARLTGVSGVTLPVDLGAGSTSTR